MQININNIKTTPNTLGFNFCVYGEPNNEIVEWAKYWDLTLVKSGAYTNILINKDFKSNLAFASNGQYSYMDGFSPNLNKKLHVGHLSNLIIANALQKLKINKSTIAIFGDTLDSKDNISTDEALKSYVKICNDFGYIVDRQYFASKMVLVNESVLTSGEGDYKGTKIFDLGEEKIVGVKSNGNTSYFYQDVALAQILNAPTLYLTGFEQNNHFNSLCKLFPNNKHISLGLVSLNGKKMSSSEGNVIMLDDFISSLLPKFNDDIKLVYNIIAGQILKTNLSSNKTIDTQLIDNPKLSMGLYLSYTMAHIISCGVELQNNKDFYSQELAYLKHKAKFNLNPSILFEGLVQHCKKINQLYDTHYIKGNPDNISMFSNLISDLKLGMESIGMFPINKV